MTLSILNKLKLLPPRQTGWSLHENGGSCIGKSRLPLGWRVFLFICKCCAHQGSHNVMFAWPQWFLFKVVDPNGLLFCFLFCFLAKVKHTKSFVCKSYVNRFSDVLCSTHQLSSILLPTSFWVYWLGYHEILGAFTQTPYPPDELWLSSLDDQVWHSLSILVFSFQGQKGKR